MFQHVSARIHIYTYICPMCTENACCIDMMYEHILLSAEKYALQMCRVCVRIMDKFPLCINHIINAHVSIKLEIQM